MKAEQLIDSGADSSAPRTFGKLTLPEGYKYHIFLSYRQAADMQRVSQLYYMLTSKGLRVWWDQKCLEQGEPWEEGFAKGLHLSMVFVSVMSKRALERFAKLDADSKCDNVLLEHRMALELRARDGAACRLILPVLVGERATLGTPPLRNDDASNWM